VAALKTLVVCLSTDLPKEADRDTNYIYFVYNTLTLFMGKAVYGENFCICDTMPELPALGTLYICLDDGRVKVYDDYRVKEIGEVENREMLNILSQAGTMYYFNSKDRYIDKHNRMLVLPFMNGSYNLVVDVPNDLLYNEKTVIIYNPDEERFEIFGETYDEDPLETKGFVGHDTQTVDIKVKDGRIEGSVRISDDRHNLIRVVEDGLFVQVHDAITQKEFDSWKTNYEQYKLRLEYFLDSISDDLSHIEELISEDAINAKIQYYLNQVYPTIDEAIAAYDELNRKILAALSDYEAYAENRFDDIETELNEKIDEALRDPWVNLDPEPEPEPTPDPEPEPDPEPTPDPEPDPEPEPEPVDPDPDDPNSGGDSGGDDPNSGDNTGDNTDPNTGGDEPTDPDDYSITGDDIDETNP